MTEYNNHHHSKKDELISFSRSGRRNNTPRDYGFRRSNLVNVTKYGISDKDYAHAFL